MAMLELSVRRRTAFSCSRSNDRKTHVCRSQANDAHSSSRRAVLLATTCIATQALPAFTAARAEDSLAGYTPMEALKDKDYGKSRMRYSDFEITPSGLQYKDFREGSGETPKAGDTVVIDWAGYTIGYYGRPFEARNKPKGSSFTGENKDFYRFQFGSGQVIPAVEEAVSGMKAGGIRRIIVPEELGYPGFDWKKQGPPPTTFAGQRALDFVLQNKGMIDKTLLFDIEIIRIQS